jgi:hypothetical protein
MAQYSGGAHPAEFIAKDGAGNVRKHTWTINVDPEGHISASEAADTVEAAQETAPEVLDGGPVDAIIGQSDFAAQSGSDPRLVQAEGHLATADTGAESTISLDPAEGMAVETQSYGEQGDGPLQGATIGVTPLGLSPGASTPEISEGSAAVTSNSSAGTDTIIRPVFDGLMAFQAIREATAPEAYSWQVALGEGETLKAIDDKHAGVFWEDGTQAMLISAQPAHGAEGSPVPTSLTVSSDNIITLTVRHRSPGVVYPVVAGTGWQGGFVTQHATFEQPEEEKEEEPVTVTVFAGSPEIVGGYDANDGDAWASSSNFNKQRKPWGYRVCGVSCDFWKRKVTGFFYFNGVEAWWPHNREPNCSRYMGANFVVEPEECDYVGPNHQERCAPLTFMPCEQTHISARDKFQAGAEGFGVRKVNPFNFVVRMFYSGWWGVYKTDKICNPLRESCIGDYQGD